MLNKGQQQFVDSRANFILGVAPAGSGKTHSMISKIQKLADERVHPRNILCITFTRAAGINIRERAEEKIGESAKEMFANTFHAFAIKVITENAKHVCADWADYEMLHGSIDFTIYDQVDRKDIVGYLIKKLSVKCTVSDVVAYIYKELDVSYKHYKDAELIAKEYKLFCIDNIALDLDDLINIATDLLEIDAVRNNYQYEYVFVDEYQDTNDTQNALIKALQPKRLIAIGDDSQSIYAFNRAKIEYILNFENEWPDVEIVNLEDNYRSTRQIIKPAKYIVDKNTQGRKKNIVAHNDGAEPVFLLSENSREEYEFVYREILSKESNYGDHAILCRTNAIASDVADYLESKQIPVKLASSSNDPFKLAHVRSVMKFIQFCNNQTDSFCFRQWINFPSRRMTDAAINSAISNARINESNITNYLPEGVRRIVENITCLQNQDIENVFEKSLEKLGVVKEYVSNRLHARISDFQDASDLILKWKRKTVRTDAKAFVKWICIKDIQEKLLEDQDAVIVGTCHSSKGLEWPHVYIVGVTEGVFPSQKASTDIEEERRLMHVAMTRAEETLTITASNFYSTPFGQIFSAGPSEFYKELNDLCKK